MAVSPCAPMKVYGTILFWGTCVRVCVCGCPPQHLCEGQSRACKSLSSPSTVWELRLSYLYTLRYLRSPPLCDFYLEVYAVMVGESCLQNISANVIYCEYGVFGDFLFLSSPPVLWKL